MLITYFLSIFPVWLNKNTETEETDTGHSDWFNFDVLSIPRGKIQQMVNQI